MKLQLFVVQNTEWHDWTSLLYHYIFSLNLAQHVHRHPSLQYALILWSEFSGFSLLVLFILDCLSDLNGVFSRFRPPNLSFNSSNLAWYHQKLHGCPRRRVLNLFATVNLLLLFRSPTAVHFLIALPVALPPLATNRFRNNEAISLSNLASFTLAYQKLRVVNETLVWQSV